MQSRYNPKIVEEKWYSYWERNRFFHVEPEVEREPYTIVIPPPNVTGILHMGHALNNTIQDILIRWRRMQGYCTLWIPGTDHAGIATQNVVEKELAKEGLTRDNLGRDRFIARIWEWREKYGSTIVKQLKKLGSSCDWEREKFTMDSDLSEAVSEAFIRLYQKGLIYKGNYIINWCPRCRTALSDEEVEYQEQEGFLYYLKYPLIGRKGRYVTVATTRPETMLGDVAVAVHPEDKRYEFLKGEKILLPLVNRELKIVKDRVVDPEFGTGAVKVTPAHDPVDFEIALRHNLEPVVVMDETGKMNENAGKYKGEDRFNARKKIVKELENQGLVEKVEPYLYSVGHCYRCETVIEPYISWQWFVRVKPLAQPAIRVVEEGKIEFFPSRWKKVYLHWMRNIRDWCISRQIWWGHRIPVYYCKSCWKPEALTSLEVKEIKELKGVIVSKNRPRVCPECGGQDIIQDEDVLDTWFSSWLWPFSTMNWPRSVKGRKAKITAEKKLSDLDYFYPTSTLVTAQEILFFWVARMIMAGLEFIEEIPFRHVYIHGTVRDEKGRKMSKSLGNIIDPLEIIEEYGADALRFSLISITAMGQDVFLSKDKFIFGRNFTNKIWNAARFLLLNLKTLQPGGKISSYSIFDKWILNSLQDLIVNVNGNLEEYNFNEAANLLYEFFWHKFCDWYIELKKRDLYSEKEEAGYQARVVLIFILDHLLRLLHPFIPFITEEIWQRLRPFLPSVYKAMGLEFNDSQSLMVSSWPKGIARFREEKILLIEDIIEVIQCIRNIRAELNLPPRRKLKVILSGKKRELLETIESNLTYLLPLANISEIKIVSGNIKRPSSSAFGMAGGIEIYVLFEGLIDSRKERMRLEKKRDKILEELTLIERKLKQKDFLNKANPNVILKVKRKKQELEEQLKGIRGIIEGL